MYKYHKDHAANAWNVFDGRGNYVRQFESVTEARQFCDYMNRMGGRNE